MKLMFLVAISASVLIGSGEKNTSYGLKEWREPMISLGCYDGSFRTARH